MLSIRILEVYDKRAYSVRFLPAAGNEGLASVKEQTAEQILMCKIICSGQQTENRQLMN